MTDRTITRALGWLSLGMGLTLRADLGDRRRATAWRFFASGAALIALTAARGAGR